MIVADFTSRNGWRLELLSHKLTCSEFNSLDPIGSPLQPLKNITVKCCSHANWKFNGSQLAKLNSIFLTCHCHKMYMVEAVGLRSSHYTFKNYNFFV